MKFLNWLDKYILIILILFILLLMILGIIFMAALQEAAFFIFPRA